MKLILEKFGLRTSVWRLASVAILSAASLAGGRTSADYSITAEATDLGGHRASSANYTNDGSAGLISGTSTAASGSVVADSGYVAQLLGAIAVPTPTPSAVVQISGTVLYCSNPLLSPVPNVTFSLTGGAVISTIGDSSGNYLFSSLPAGDSYTVTPSKASLPPGGMGSSINTIDVVATQRHILQITLLSGCRLTAADVTGDSVVNTIDVIAIQRFILGQGTGFANTGHYRFSPVSRTYTGVNTNQAGQNYNALIFGDVASPFAARDGGPSPDAAGDQSRAGELPSTVARVVLPNVFVDSSAIVLTAPVVSTFIDRKENLVGFQGDFTFDSTVLTFESEPVQKAGLTSGDWNVSGNVLPGPGPIRTLRVSAYSNTFEPLTGSGTLFELRIGSVALAPRITQLFWAEPPDHFIFIGADLSTQRPVTTVSGSVTLSGRK